MIPSCCIGAGCIALVVLWCFLCSRWEGGEMGEDLVALVSQRTTLKKSGRMYLGLCPFHEEKTPSFTVNPKEQTYYCFGCGKHGGVREFEILMATKRRR